MPYLVQKYFLPLAIRLPGVLVAMHVSSGPIHANPPERFEALRHESKDGQSLLYRLHRPADTSTPAPLILFLHGAGERGNDNAAQLKHGARDILRYLDTTGQTAWLLAPQCPTEQRWVEVDWGATEHRSPDASSAPLRMTKEVIDALILSGGVDTSRIYVTGLSMGGYGTWDALQRWPDFFAAGIPVCGGGDEKGATQFHQVPVWAFHGDADKAVPVVRSRSMIAALKAAGGSPQYTEYPGVGHDSWTPTYRNADVLEWFLKQRRTPAP